MTENKRNGIQTKKPQLKRVQLLKKKPKTPTHGYVELVGEDTLYANISVTNNDGSPAKAQAVWMTDTATGARETFLTNENGVVISRPKRILLVEEKVNLLFEFPGTDISPKHLTVYGPSASQTFRPQVPHKNELGNKNFFEVIMLAWQRAHQITSGSLEQSSRLEIVQSKSKTWWGWKEGLFMIVQRIWLDNNWWPQVSGGIFVLSLVCYIFCPEQYPKVSARFLEMMGMSFLITVPLFICSRLDELGVWLYDLLISFREKRSAKQKLPVTVKKGKESGAVQQKKTESMLHWIGDNVIGEVVGALFAHTLEKKGRIIK